MSSKPSTPFDDALIVPAQLDQLRTITRFIGEVAGRTGFFGTQLSRIELAVDEACSNIIQHAYEGHKDGQIRVGVRAEPGHRIVISLDDTGTPFDPDVVPNHDPLATNSLDDLKVGGLGLYLMRQTMDEVHFEFGIAQQVSGKTILVNRLTMVKNL